MRGIASGTTFSFFPTNFCVQAEQWKYNLVPSKVLNPLESSYQGQDQCILQLAQICRIPDPGNKVHGWGQEDLCLLLCSWEEGKLGRACSTGLAGEIILEYCLLFPVWSSQRMLKTGKDSKCSLCKRKLGTDLIKVHKYFSREIDF